MARGRPDAGACAGHPASRVLIAAGVLSSLVYLSFARTTTGQPLLPDVFAARRGVIFWFLAHFALLLGLYMVAAWAVIRRPLSDRASLISLVAFACLFRALLLPTRPILSDDIYRYAWDGKVQAAGFNPYRYPPEAPELAHLRDALIHPRINRPWARTIYPAGAQWLFRAFFAIAPDSILGLKLGIAACDALTIGLLMWLLRARGYSESRALLYAWHPLVVFELAGSGHVEGLMLPWLLLCLALSAHGRAWAAGVPLGLATAIKLYPALLAAPLIRRHGPCLLLPAATVLGALYLPYLGSGGGDVLGFLPRYLSDPGERFNAGPGGLAAYGLGLLLGRPMLVAQSFLAFALIGAGLVGARRREPGLEATLAELLVLIGTFVTFAQTLHPWYLVWALPALAFQPRASWLYLSGAVALSYLTYTHAALQMPCWAVILEYLPFYLLGLGPARIRKLQEAASRLLAS